MQSYQVTISGMSCGHCSAAVTRALNALEGVEATVDLERSTALVRSSGPIAEEAIRAAVEGAGYAVKRIQSAM